MEGWIKLHRCLIDKPIFDNANLLKVWIWCLCKATHKNYIQVVGLKKIELSTGQFITGRNSGAIELKLKPSTFWDYMQFLKNNKSININSNNKYSVVTVTNWGLYQVNDNISDSETDNKPLTKQPPSNTNKNIKTVKNDKKNIYGEFSKVLLTTKEYEKLVTEYGVEMVDKFIKTLDEYIEEKGYKSKSHNLAIRRWVIDSIKNKKPSYGQRSEQTKQSVGDKAKEAAERYEFRHGIKTSNSNERDIPCIEERY